MSSSVTRGFERTFSNSSSLRVIGNCWMLNESAPAWLRIACFTDAFRPWISDTTAMIDVTATMLPRTVMNDRSLADQIASRAISADSAKLRMVVMWDRCAPSGLPGPLGVVHLHQIAVGHAADGVVGAGDHLIAGFQPAEHLEVLVAGDSHLDREKLGAALVHQEHAFHFLPRLSRLQLRGRRHRLDGRPGRRRAAALPIARLF